MQVNDKDLAKELYKKYSAVTDAFLFIFFLLLVLISEVNMVQQDVKHQLEEI